MRLFLFVFVVSLHLSPLCQAQYLSFDELLSLRAKELDEVNDFLIKKKWEIDNAKEGDFSDYNRATWAFNRNDDNNKAQAWFTYFYSEGSTNIVRYMTTSGSHHDLIKTRIKALGFKLTDKSIEENGLAFTYTNGQRSVKENTDKDEDGVSRFVFTITKRTTKPSSQNHSTYTTPQQTPTPKTGTVTDIDGNTYKTVQIGTQTWMAENLRTTKYNDGEAIPYVTDNSVWVKLETPAYCYYNNDISNKKMFGALYNWYTVNTGRLCPSGWHVPTDAEWTTLAITWGAITWRVAK